MSSFLSQDLRLKDVKCSYDIVAMISRPRGSLSVNPFNYG